MTRPNKWAVLILFLWIVLLTTAIATGPNRRTRGRISYMYENPIQVAKFVGLAPGMWTTSTPMLLLVVIPLGMEMDGFVRAQPYVAAIMWALLLFTAFTSGRPGKLKWFYVVIFVESLLILITFATMVPVHT